MSDVPSVPPIPNDALMTAADDEKQITIHAVGADGQLTTAVSGRDPVTIVILSGQGEISNKPKGYLEIKGTVRKYCIGLGSRPNYVLFDEDTVTKEVEEFVFAKPENSELQSESDSATKGENHTEHTTNKSSSSTDQRPSFGKKVVTDKNGERVTGRNPLADPDRLKDTGLHQGGN